MFLFGRNRVDDPGAEFWKWWPDARERIATAIVSGAFDDRIINDINKHVQRIHPEMGWELQPGAQAAHAFCLAAEGDPARRQVALRWFEGAPKPDATWEYHASKQPAKTLMTLMVGGARFDLEEMRASTSWDETRRLLDVRLWHPRFAEVPEAIRMQAAFLFLDHLLGEDGVERWIGAIELFDAPTGGRTPAELRAEVDRHAGEPAGDDTWINGERTRPDGTAELVIANAVLKRIDYPFHDTWVWVQMLWGEDRYPSDAEAAQLNDEEDNFLERMGDRAILAARVTVPGSRTWHFVSPDFEKMRPAIDGWAAWLPDSLSPGLPQRRLKIDGAQDMSWEFQRNLGLR
jgi:hypothetical protein